MTQQHKIVEEDEYLKMGGSPIDIDLANLVRERVRDATNSVRQLADNHRQMLIINSTAMMQTVTAHHLFTCVHEGRLMPLDEYLSVIDAAMREHLQLLHDYLNTKEKGATVFQNMLKDALGG